MENGFNFLDLHFWGQNHVSYFTNSHGPILNLDLFHLKSWQMSYMFKPHNILGLMSANCQNSHPVGCTKWSSSYCKVLTGKEELRGIGYNQSEEQPIPVPSGSWAGRAGCRSAWQLQFLALRNAPWRCWRDDNIPVVSRYVWISSGLFETVLGLLLLLST